MTRKTEVQRALEEYECGDNISMEELLLEELIFLNEVIGDGDEIWPDELELLIK